MKKIRILFFVPFMNGGGAERVILTLISNIDKARFEPILVMMKKEGRYLSMIPKDIEVIDLKASQARYAILKVIQVIRQKKPDIVFATLAYLNLIIAMIRPLLSKEIKFVARESNTVSVRNKREKYPKLFDWLYKHIYKNFDVIVTQAAFMRDDLVHHYGIDKDKMRIIYNPINTKDIDVQLRVLNKPTHSLRLRRKTAVESFTSGFIQNTQLKNQHHSHYHDRDYHLLSVGKLGYQKGYDMLLRIMTHLPAQFHLTILGEGADKQALQEQIETLDLTNRVNLAGFSDNPFPFMKEADLLLLPSRYEGLPNVVLEAAYCKTPTVAFDAPGGTGEIIEEGFNGFLVPAFDEVAFAKTIEKAMSYDFDVEAIRQNSIKKYAVAHIIEQYQELFIEQGA